jgi:hypothetical protein
MADVRTCEMCAKFVPLYVTWNFVFWRIMRRWTTSNKTNLSKSQKQENGWSWSLKLTFFYGDYLWTVTVRQSLVQWKVMDINISFIWIITFFGGAFQYGGVSIFWGYVGTNAGQLYVKLCNFVQLHIFISYSYSYCSIW